MSDKERRTMASRGPFGRAGITHCGVWIPIVPGDRGAWVTRMVCTELAGHIGQHYNQYYDRGWPRGETP